ncbi:MAG: hypothetical protein IJB80_04500 [Clostridia bacterium]|nr:hypothetical protein [Clostridia bacterium]
MKKIISMIISVVMLLSIVSVPSFATETATVYMDYDFENYTGAHKEVQDAAKSGATVTFNSNTYAETTVDDFAIDGDTGLRMVENITGTRWFYVTLPNPVTSGKVYLSFDVARMNHVTNSGQHAFVCVGETATGAVSANIALRLNGAGVDSYDADTTKKLALTHSATTTTITHIDQVYEISNSGKTVDIDTYINGALAGEKTLTVNSFKVINFQLTATISYLDNLRISTMTDTSFAASVSGTVTDDADYVDVKFTEGILSSSVLPENVVLKDAENNTIAVDKVEKYRGRTLRVYPAEKLSSGQYTLNVNGIERIRNDEDSPVKYSGNINFQVYNGLLYFNDMENTSDGKMNGAYSPGLLTTFYGDAGYTAVEEEADGNNYIVPQMNNDNQRMQMTLNHPISSGVLNIRFDVKVDPTETGVPFRLQARKTDDNTFMNLLSIDAGKINTMATQAYNVWGFGGASYPCTSGTKYTIDVLHNLSDGAIDVYVDGVLLQHKPAKAADAGAVNRIHFQLSKDVTYLDNVSISYMAKGSYCADINPVVDGATVLNLRMRESAKLDTLSAEDVTVKDNEGNTVECNVTITGNTGTFIKIESATPFSKEKTYTIDFGDAVNIVGNAAKALVVTPVDLFEIVEYSLTDAEGNPISDLAQIPSGTAVKVNVVVKNNGTAGKPASLLVGAYTNEDTVLESAGILSDWNLTALDETSGTAEIEIISPQAVNLYAYVWSDLTTREPLVTKIPIE